MSSLAIIGVFLGFGVLIAILLGNPQWRATQLLFEFRGPYPSHGESYVHFQMRRARYSATVFLALSLLAGLAAYIDRPDSQIGIYIQGGVLLILSIGTLMAAVAMLGYLLIGAWHRLFVKKHLFNKETCFFEDAT